MFANFATLVARIHPAAAYKFAGYAPLLPPAQAYPSSSFSDPGSEASTSCVMADSDLHSDHGKTSTNGRDIEENEVLKPTVVGDEEFGGTEARKILEKKLLRKLDLRMSILIVIYILNYVRYSILLT